MDFIDAMIEEMPFSIQRIQTYRGRESFATQFQEPLLEWGIKFRQIKPASPHQNGNVERSQRTDLAEFYSTIDLRIPTSKNCWRSGSNITTGIARIAP